MPGASEIGFTLDIPPLPPLKIELPSPMSLALEYERHIDEMIKRLRFEDPPPPWWERLDTLGDDL